MCWYTITCLGLVYCVLNSDDGSSQPLKIATDSDYLHELFVLRRDEEYVSVPFNSLLILLAGSRTRTNECARNSFPPPSCLCLFIISIPMYFRLETLTDASKEVGLEVNVEKTKYTLVSGDQNAGQNWEIKIGNRSFENVSQFKYLGTTVTDQNLI
jgi:hypothetical protein